MCTIQLTTYSQCLLLAALFAAPLSAAEDAWETIDLVQSGNLAVRLRFNPIASLADEEWIAFEFENRGDADIRLERMHYRMSREGFDQKTGTITKSGSLASGSRVDLFPDAWKSTPVADCVVRPGTTRFSNHPSLYSSALLGLPGVNGDVVKADIHIDLKVGGAVTQTANRQFEFRWGYPTEDGFRQMQTRLHQLLANPRNEAQHAYILNALLNVPMVAEDLSVSELLGSLTGRTEPFSGREYVLSHINDRYAVDSIVTDSFMRRLSRDDERVFSDLQRAHNVWHKEFMPLIIERFENDRTSVSGILALLHARGMPHRKNPRTAARLSSALLRHGWTIAPPDLASDPELRASYIGRNLIQMGMTGDTRMLPRLAPFLDDRTQILDLNDVHYAMNAPPPAFRICDCAADAIRLVLDGPQPAGRQQLNIEELKKALSGKDTPDAQSITSRSLSDSPAAHARQQRERMLKDARKRLAEFLRDQK